MSTCFLDSCAVAADDKPREEWLQFSGLSPNYPGVWQINVYIPEDRAARQPDSARRGPERSAELGWDIGIPDHHRGRSSRQSTGGLSRDAPGRVRLSAYMLRSASSSASRSGRPAASAIPQLNVIGSMPNPRTRKSRSRASISVMRLRAISACWFWNRITNSSPPQRNASSSWRIEALQQVADVAQDLVAHQVAVAVVDVLEIVHVADRHHAVELRRFFHRPRQRRLVEQARQPVQVQPVPATRAAR